MPTLDPGNEVLSNLEVLLDMEILKREKEWPLLRELDQLPPEGLVNKVIKANTRKDEDDAK
jgi:hypothetical protein